MKDKYSIFSPPASKTDSFASEINFKNSPNKFFIYEPLNKFKDPLKILSHQSLSSTNLENVRKLPNEYLNLRQTLSFKPSNFDSLIHDDEKDKMPKSSSYLRQTISTKTGNKSKVDKTFS